MRSSASPGAAVGDLGRAAEAGDLAEQVVERHRREGQADHQRDEGAAGRRRSDIARARGLGLLLLLSASCCHDHSGRFRTPGPFTSVTTKKRTTSTPSEQRERDRTRGGARASALRRQDDAVFLRACRSRSDHLGQLPERQAEAALDQQHGEQQEQVEDREAEQRLGGLFGRPRPPAAATQTHGETTIRRPVTTEIAP